MAKLTRASYVKIVLIILLGALVLGAIGFGGCSSWRYGIIGGSEMGSANVEAASVKNLTVKWASGAVDVHVVDGGDSIELIETAPRGLTKTQEMRWTLNGDTLTVDSGSWFSCFMLGRKDLEVRIPESYAQKLGSVRIDGASGDYGVSDLGCEELDLKLASGDVDAHGLTANKVRIDVASGNLDVRGRFADSVNVRTASGETWIVCEEVCPRTVDADLASGVVSVAVPQDSGFTAKVTKASGQFSSAFPLAQSGNEYVAGDGSARFDIRLASGAFRIDSSS